MTHEGDTTEKQAISGQNPLQGWKEIASYLERDARTARRWEQQAGLPVRRHGGDRGSVYAYPSELEAWRAARKPKAGEASEPRRWRRVIPALAGGVALLVAAWIVQWGPIMNPPDPLAEAAKSEVGVTLRKVWAGGELWTYYSISPDGRYVSFADDSTGDLKIRDLDTADTQSLARSNSAVKEFALWSRFSPDGSRLAYVWAGDINDLRVLDVDRPVPRVIYRNKEISYMEPIAWTPDGSRILLLGFRGDGISLLGFLPTAGGELLILKSFDWRYPKASLSPDGRFVAYDLLQERNSPAHDIYILAADGSSESRVVEHPADDSLVGWTPAGDGILFTSDRSSKRDLWSLPLKEGKVDGVPLLVKSNVEMRYPLGITRKGSLFYVQVNRQSDLYLADLNPATGKLRGAAAPATTSFVQTYGGAAWSPDGKRLAYVSVREGFTNSYLPGARGLRIRDIGTGKEIEHDFGIRGMTEPRWSPNGDELLLGGYDKDSRAYYRADLRTGSATKVLDEDEMRQHVVPVWARDGKSLFVGALNMKTRQAFILRHDLVTGAETELYRMDDYHGAFLYPNLSPDGRTLAFHFDSPDEKTRMFAIQLLPVEGGQPRDLVRHRETVFCCKDMVTWSPDSRYLYFTRTTGDLMSDRPKEVWRISVANGRQEFTGLRRPGIWRLRMHPQDSRLAFVAGKDKAEIWAMENFLPETRAAN